MKKFFKFLIWLIVVLYTAFIFSNSLMDGAESGNFSYRVANYLANFLNNHGIYFYMSTFHAYLRKLAHFTEFFGLGFLTAIAIVTCPLFKSRLLNFLLFIIAIPCADETIQYFVPGRACSIKDMIIDFSGMLCGGFCVYVCYLIIKDLFFRQPRKN
ncbi:MAG: VanZ family protein [Erysipelotrichaceae bacterium]|nr:VanZ family protein [Erysipelotrichaceae bacterium]